MTVGVGVIGTGRMGGIHLRNLSEHLPQGHVEAIGGTNRARLDEAADRCGAKRVYTDPFALILDPKVDAVLVASPASTHAAFVIAAIQANKSVFVEKPLSTSAASALQVAETENATGRRHVRLGFMRRYDPAHIELRETVINGSIGSPLMVHCAHRLPAVTAAFGSEMLITEGLTHEIDSARWLTGSEIRTVRVYTPGPSGRAVPGVDDPQFVVLETDEGQLIDVEVSVNAGYAYDIRCEVVCEDGTVELEDFSLTRVRRDNRSASPLSRGWAHRFHGAFREELRTWLDDVSSGTPTGPNAWDGYAAALVAEACVRSLRAGTEVAVPLPPRPALYAMDRPGLS